MKGKYLGRAIGTEWGRSQKGNMQIAVTCEITQACDEHGKTITWFGTFSDAATEMAVRALRAFGWEGDDLSDLDNLDTEQCKRFLGREVELVIEEEEYDGKVRSRVRFVNEPGTGKFAFKEPVGGNDLRRFAASMKSAIKAIGGGGGGKPNGSRKDDVPF